MQSCIGVNARGYRVGEYHHRSKLTDAIVDLIREMHEERCRSYSVIARVLKLSVRTVGKICRYEIRAQTPERWKQIAC